MSWKSTTYNQAQNNPMYGRKHSEESRRKMSESKKGKNNPQYGLTKDKAANWNNIKENAKSAAIHAWLKKRIPKPELCVICNVRPPFDLANISPVYDPDTYDRDFKNWRWICHSCHVIGDGRIRKATIAAILARRK